MLQNSHTYLSTQSNLEAEGLDAGASFPPTAYMKPFRTPTPTPPRRLAIDAHGVHLSVWGS